MGSVNVHNIVVHLPNVYANSTTILCECLSLATLSFSCCC